MAAQPAPKSDRLSASNSTSPKPAKRRILPQGPCNFRDLNAGPKPPSCGCRRFWWNEGLLTTNEHVDNRQAQEYETNPWCVCGHHACFHDLVERIARGGLNLEAPHVPMAPPPAPEAEKRGLRGQVYNSLRSQRVGLTALNHLQQGSILQVNEKGGENPQTENSSLQARDEFSTNTSAPVLPSLPSFHVNSSELQAFNGYDIRQLAQPQGMANTTAGVYNGLGLTLYERSLRQARQLSQSPTVADGSAAEEVPPNDSYLPSTRQTSSDEAPLNISPNPGFLHRVMEARRAGPALDITTIGGVANAFEDFIQSATELATPSAGNTPDFGGLNQLVQDARQAIHTVTTLEVSPNAHSEMSPERIVAVQDGQEPQANSSRSLPPAKQDDSVIAAIRKMPTTLQQIAPMLNALQGYLSRNPDISIHESINSLSKRMDALENASFSQVPAEQIHQQFENVDGRIVDLENRVDEHGRILTTFEPENSLQERYLQRLTAGENALLDTRQSREAADSHRMDIDRRVKDVEERLDDLEKMRPPSLAHPWEIDVVLLPWGRDLKGIWYPTDELLKPGMTQDSEIWTQARSVRSQSRASVSLGADRDSGWSSQAIHDWADNTEHWLSPKACGTNGVVFHRLRSRGLVRTVILASGGARDIQASICKAFGDLLYTVSGTMEHSEASHETSLPEKPLLGMSAPFIPLRKVHKSSRLRFLTSPDLVSPALWTADFLASGVVMRAPAGQKRLFVTTCEAYVQQSSNLSSSWTWGRLKGLPRVVNPEVKPSVSTGSNDSEPALAEPCWAHHPALDGLPSVHSSFTSHHSASFHDPSDDDEPAQSEEYEEEPDDDSLEFHPITPTSEFPTQKPHYPRRARTVSVPLTDASSTFAFDLQQQQQQQQQQQRSFPQLLSQPKRRIRSFEQSNNPDLIAKLPTFIPSPSKTRSRLGKRRRIAKSRSRSGSQDSAGLSIDVDPERVIMHVMDRVSSGESLKPLSAFTPRYSKEPGSPFFERGSTHGGASQSTGGAINLSRTEKRGITPSAYATPFSGTGLGKRVEDESGDEDVWGGVEERNAVSPAEEDDQMDDEGFDEGYDDEEDEDGGSLGDESMDEEDNEVMSQSADELQVEYY
jgi:type IV secretory pathway protease TraF